MIGASGLSYRIDKSFGLLLYSSASGLFYAVRDTDSAAVENWLATGERQAPSEIIDILTSAQNADRPELALKAGALLPGVQSWDTLPVPDLPIVVNWFITGACQLQCVYCYAQDLMSRRVVDGAGIAATACQILKYDPVAVVLTGGDPLFSPDFRQAIEAISGHCGIIVDTNGLALDDNLVALLQEHNATVRISLDSEVPAVTRRQRPVVGGGDSTAFAVRAIDRALEAGLPVSVQTVATYWNTPDLPYLGDKLYRMGVRLWRIHKVAPSAQSAEGYRASTRARTGRAGTFDGMFENFVEKQLAVRARRWMDSMAVQVTPHQERNSVVLVAPDGGFYTESKLRLQKIPIDPDSVFEPSTEALHLRVNMGAHVERYLGSQIGRGLA